MPRQAACALLLGGTALVVLVMIGSSTAPQVVPDMKTVGFAGEVHCEMCTEAQPACASSGWKHAILPFSRSQAYCAARSKF